MPARLLLRFCGLVPGIELALSKLVNGRVLLLLFSVGCSSSEPSLSDGGPAAVDAGSDATENRSLDSGAYDGGAADGGADLPQCSIDRIGSLDSSAGLTLVEGPIPCDSPDETEVHCGIFKARLEVPTSEIGPTDDPPLDDEVQALAVFLTLRAAPGVDVCSARWVTFDAGGFGLGYAPQFGFVPMGHFVQGGDGYGDDLIRAYNDLGYVTLDVSYGCSEAAGEACDRDDLRAWADSTLQVNRGSSWYRDTDGTGYTGAASRALAIYTWAYENSRRRLCSHAQSSGSGRLNTVLTRFGAEDMFDTVVFEGGPVFTDPAWLCGRSDGPLGPVPSWFAPSAIHEPIWGCAISPAPNDTTCLSNVCSLDPLPEIFDRDSIFARAEHRTLDEIDIKVIFGGDDTSPAAQSAQLWLSGYTGSLDVPSLRAKSIGVYQGYCSNDSGTYTDVRGGRPCSDWFGLPSSASVAFDSDLKQVEHDVAISESGANVTRRAMLETCEP